MTTKKQEIKFDYDLQKMAEDYYRNTVEKMLNCHHVLAGIYKDMDLQFDREDSLRDMRRCCNWMDKMEDGILTDDEQWWVWIHARNLKSECIELDNVLHSWSQYGDDIAKKEKAKALRERLHTIERDVAEITALEYRP